MTEWCWVILNEALRLATFAFLVYVLARLLAVKPADVRNGRRPALKPSTFINGRGWV